MRAQGKEARAKTSTIKACPTVGHMALKSLEKAGILKFLISQNVDGLHRRSGFPPEKLAELHGNTNLEICKSCGKQYLRDYSCSAHHRNINDHSTGRKCSCGGELHDSIIHFGENLPKKALKDGFRHAEMADLILVLGSSVTVTPAADMPVRTVEKGGKLVICNLQKTPLDSISCLRVFSRTDDLMIRVIDKLGLQLEQWKLIRHIGMEIKRDTSGCSQLEVFGVEADGTPASILSAVKIDIQEVNFKSQLNFEPFRISFKHREDETKWTVNAVLEFMGHYNEPPLDIQAVFSSPNQKLLFRLEYDPRKGTWTVDSL